MKIIKAFGMVTVLSAFGKVLGFVREALIASYFGASGTADVFFVAFLIPTILFTALGTAIQAGIVPLYIKQKEQDAGDAADLLKRLGSFFIFASFGLTILAMLLVQPLVRVVAPGFDQDQTSLAILLTLIMLPSLIFMTVQSLMQGILHSNEKFGFPAWAPLINNMTIIVLMYALYEWIGIRGLAIGVLAGSAMQILIQLPGLEKGERLSLFFNFRRDWPMLKKVLVPFYPIIIASLLVQLNGVVDRVVSSFLVEGSVSALNYGNRLLWLPLSIILMPISTILYPYLSKVATKGFTSFMALSNAGIKAILLLSIPLQVVMVVEAENLVTLAFERGAFDAGATQLTSEAFIFFAIALPFFAMRDYLMNSFYAYELAKTAMYSCLFGVVLNIVLSVSLAQMIGIGGVALATSMSMLVQSVYLYLYLRKKGETNRSAGMIRWAAVFALLILGVWGIQPMLPELNVFLSLTLTTLVTLILYSVLLYLFRLHRLKETFSILTDKGESR